MFSSKAIVLSTLSLAMCAGAASAQLQFAPAVNYSTPTRPSGVTSADFNRDGIIDLAVTTDNPDRVSVLLGTGTGQFAAPILVPIPNGQGLGALVAGDFNGNGTVDLAVVLKNTSQVAILMNNGSGQFIMGSMSSVGALPVDIKAGDIDGNGTLDLVTANRDGDSISVLRNNGTAVFTVQTLAAGLEPRSVALGDLNNNGTLDAVVSLHDADAVATFLNTGGVFSAPVSTPVAAGQSPEGIAIADVNNDGFKDVLYTIGNDLNLGQNFVGLFNGNGSGVLTTSRLFPTNGLDSSRMVAADFNVDGFADIAVTNESGSTVSVLIGSAAGLSAPTLLNVGTHPDGIIAADLNADGRSDIATSNRDSNNTSVILSIFCLADFNSDGVVDFADYLDFVNLFASSSAGADVNRDGTIDFFDYLDFVAAFSAGC